MRGLLECGPVEIPTEKVGRRTKRKEATMSDESAIVVSGAVENTGTDSVFLAARNSEEMATSQKQLAEWLMRKMRACTREYNDLQAGAREAEAHKWSSKALRAAASKMWRRVVYYDKLRQAVEAGYVVIPWMRYDAFAVRVVREEHRSLMSTSDYHTPNIPEQHSAVAPAGEGRYVSASSAGYTGSRTERTPEGKDKKVYYAVSTGFREVEFPLMAAKPVLMNAAAQAMALKIFDEIGIAPNIRGRDPFVVGTVQGPAHRNVIFLIAWYLDTRALGL